MSRKNRACMELVVHSPFDGHRVGAIEEYGVADLDRAIARARGAFQTTSAFPRHVRQRILRTVAQALSNERDDLAGLIVAEGGKPLRYARAEVDRAISTFSLAADEVTRSGGEIVPLDVTPAGEGYTAMVTRRPIGVIGAIAPFNFPLNLVAHKLAPAIAIGNTMVLKAPPQAPLTAKRLERIVTAAGWPTDGLSVFHAPVEVAQLLATDDRIAMLSFTGSSAVGWKLKSIAGRKRVALELGGNAAAIVCEDADVAWAAKRCALGAFAQSGQVCIKVQRIYCDARLYDAFVEALLRETRALPCGDPSDDRTVVGPVVDDASCERIMTWIDEAKGAGATVLTGGTRDGRVIAPTLLTGTRQSMRVESEEIFGPVATVAPFGEFHEAIAAVNASRYGLQAGIFTHDVRRIARAFEDLEVGGVIANDYPTLRIDNFPYGGIKDSGFGREGVRYAMDEMSELKTLVVRYA